MNSRIRNSASRLRPCHIVDDSFSKVEQGLAYTPSQMRQMAEKGIPINTLMANETFFDGDYNNSTDLPLEFTRGIDSIDAWNAERDSRKRLAAAHRNDVNLYGNSSNDQ